MHVFNIRHADIIIKRAIFNAKYCEKKGWDITNLTWEQIMEIRSQEGWKNPK